jgi:hypothetical protein
MHDTACYCAEPNARRLCALDSVPARGLGLHAQSCTGGGLFAQFSLISGPCAAGSLAGHQATLSGPPRFGARAPEPRLRARRQGPCWIGDSEADSDSDSEGSADCREATPTQTDNPCTHATLALLGELSMPCNRTCACNRTRLELLPVGELGLARCRGAPALFEFTALCYAPPWRYVVPE